VSSPVWNRMVTGPGDPLYVHTVTVPLTCEEGLCTFNPSAWSTSDTGAWPHDGVVGDAVALEPELCPVVEVGLASSEVVVRGGTLPAGLFELEHPATVRTMPAKATPGSQSRRIVSGNHVPEDRVAAVVGCCGVEVA